MTRNTGICILILLICATTLVFGTSEGPPRFAHLGYQDGLSSSSVSSIVQDDSGFLWFGTQNGLNRYDGHSLTIFQNEPFNSNSLTHNLIQTMYLDSGNILWIGTYGGLVRYDLFTNTFTSYRVRVGDDGGLSNNVVVSIVRDKQGNLWVGTMNGLNRLDEESGEFTVFRHDPLDPASLNHNVVRALFCDEAGRLWVGTYGGLALFNPATEEFTRYCATVPSDETSCDDNHAILSSNYVMDIEQGVDGTLWLGLWDGGLVQFYPETGQVETHRLSEERMYALLVDDDTIWAASYGGGLIEFHPEDSSYQIYTSESSNADGLSDNTVYSLYKDRSGVIWVGTNGGGLNKIIPGWDQFQFWKHSTHDATSIAQGKVNYLMEDSFGDIWISIYNNGVDRYNQKTGDFQHFTHDPDNANSISNNIVNCIYEDRNGTLWIGSNNGIDSFDRENGQFIRFSDPESENTAETDVGQLSDTIIKTVVEHPDGALWFGTYSNGLVYYNAEQNKQIWYRHDPDDPASISDNMVRSIIIDLSNNLWVGTNNGLNRFIPETGTFKRYYHKTDTSGTISSSNIYDLYEDSMGTLWIATMGGGVNAYHPETDTFTYYSRKNGLSDNSVIGMLEDNNRNLWISTRYGLTICNLVTKKFQIINNTNGFPVMEMTIGKEILQDGTILFGTVDGVVLIDSNMESVQFDDANLILTRFRVMGENIETEHPLHELDEIVLKYQDGSIDFEFTEQQYISPITSNYAYMLEGFDAKWNFTDNRNYGSYTNLPTGTYILKIRAIHQNGVWNPNEITITVRVLPPFWLTGWAYLIYSLVFILACLLVWRWFYIRRKFQRQLLEQKERDNALLEAEVIRRTEEIDTHREQLAITLRSIGEGVIAADMDGNILFLNRAAEELTGWNQQEALGQPLKKVLLLLDNSAKNPQVDPMQRLEGVPLSSAFKPYLMQVSRDGTKRVVSEIGAPIRSGSSDQPTGIVVIFRDMTQEQKMQIRLQQNDKLDSLGILAGGLAHDFNNLLGGLFGYIEMARDLSEQDEVITMLDSSLEAFNRAKALTQQLLTFSKGETPARKPINLGDIVRKSASFALSGSNVTSEVTIAEDLWICEADEYQIGQVVDNIVINAQQSMPEGGKVTIDLKNASVQSDEHPGLLDGDYVQLTISDQGSGIPLEIQEKIFDPFFTTKSTGNGLGLATCYSIIEKHHGIIEVESTSGKGTSMMVYLPRSEGEIDEIEAEENDLHDGAGLFLIMDDEETIRNVLSLMLEKMGYDVATAASGEEALEVCRSLQSSGVEIDAAILDITVPGGKGGKDIVDELKELFPDIVVLASSGYSSDPIIADPETYGFTDSIKKPYRQRELAELLNTLLH